MQLSLSTADAQAQRPPHNAKHNIHLEWALYMPGFFKGTKQKHALSLPRGAHGTSSYAYAVLSVVFHLQTGIIERDATLWQENLRAGAGLPRDEGGPKYHSYHPGFNIWG